MVVRMQQAVPCTDSETCHAIDSPPLPPQNCGPPGLSTIPYLILLGQTLETNYRPLRLFFT
ncbi:MAG: hypothetical protein MJE68_02885 [Proteobacteria bacterium]|nr:hypothetical protein [Pseudomonadota bacterium]